MDVECEAPLNNSFQKDRRELVNKGSLGRRRKPSRSNLRLILSPGDDRQDIDCRQPLESESSFIREKVNHLQESFLDQPSSHRGKNYTNGFNYLQNLSPADDRPDIDCRQQLESESSFIQEKVNRLQDSVLDNQHSSLRGKNYTNGINHLRNSHLGTVPNNYHEVVASINQINRTKSIDVNGNSQQLTSKNLQRLSSNNLEEISNNGHQKNLLKNNNVNSEHSSKVYVIKNQQKETAKFAKLSNGHDSSKNNGYQCDASLKSEKNTEIKNNHQPITICNHQKSTSIPKTHLNIITFSNRRQIVTPVPVQSTKSAVHNGNHYVASSKNRPSSQQIEPSLPRTSKGLSLVDEARQFSIEAKLKRKKSEVQGRSAVLIQTWERRTQSESHSKLRRDSIDAPKNRFGGTEHCDVSAMPDSYICIKYKGSLQNGDYLQQGELVPSVRDVRPDNTMLYRVPEDRSRRTHLSGSSNGSVTVNGNSSAQEPEWISLSKKLCAKFVEGHIEHYSTDSYQHEEPEGVVEEPVPSPQPTRTPSGPVTRIVHPEVQKINKPTTTSTPATPSEEAPASKEPPWIHLSRKLCNKFIEEHIEYPPITNGHFVEVPELVEPNGDVRIIEKIGKPKGRKSKQKKDSEPEWISLSKKLRAKFIESHIDDPDTIALDNQLNASDPEEAGSETLSDISQDSAVPRMNRSAGESLECKNTLKRNQVLENEVTYNENGTNQNTDKCYKNNESNTLLEKECCWEYQEMEFDTESNSGNFQEPESYDQPLQEARMQRKSLFEDNSDKIEERVTFADCHSFRGPECLNNDVNFAPRVSNDESMANNSQQKKLITVQFIAHSKKDQSRDFSGKTNFPQYHNEVHQEPFFNLSTWEEAHFQEKNSDDYRSPGVTLGKDVRSKSLDNLCDSLETNTLAPEANVNKFKKRNSFHSTIEFDAEEDFVFMSEKSLRRKENENILDDEFKTECFNDVHLTQRNGNCNYDPERTVNESEYNYEFSRFCSQENEQNIQKEKDKRHDEKIQIAVKQKSKQKDDTLNDKSYPECFNNAFSVKGNGNCNCISEENASESEYNNEFSSFSLQENERNIQKEFESKNEKRIQNEINQKIKQNENSLDNQSYPKNFNDVFSIEENGNCNCISEDIVSASENNTASSSFRSQNSERNSPERKDFEISSEDEVFECSSRSKKPSSGSKEGNHYGKISPKTNSDESERKHSVPKQINGENIKNYRDTKNKNAKCNGIIPNSCYDDFSGKHSGSAISKHSQSDMNKQNCSKEPPKMGMSKWITISKSEQNIHKPEYKNVQQTSIQANQKKSSEQKAELKSKSMYKSEQNINMPEYSNLVASNQTSYTSSDSGSELKYKSKSHSVTNIGETEKYLSSKEKNSPKNEISRQEIMYSSDCNRTNGNSNDCNGSLKNSELKFKCKSLCDISNTSNSKHKENSFRQHESVADLCSATQTDDYSKIEFQHFDCDSEIPLCAKLVSNHEKRITRNIPSATPHKRDESPSASESSHVYEDMFKETPSGPSDSEASSWTVMKSNTYYVNGRSSSMNDLDLSDSCSMSVKCDYASSSENSTLQSRHSSCASSSFYVNLRDYDSHMLEPSLTKNKRSNGKTANNGIPSNVSKSNPPTPESLRHLFTSPLNSIHSPPHRNPRLLSRMPSDPQSHYYSTAAATSSAFKHGFAPTSPKQKKTERSSSIKIKDIAHGIILTFKRFHNHSKNSNLPSTQQVDVSHLAEMKSNSELGKGKKGHKETKSKNQDKSYRTDNGRTDSDSGFLSDVQRAKARRSSSDLTDWKSNSDLFGSDKKKGKSSKKGKKSKNKVSEPRTIPTVSRKVQQMADGTLYLVTTVSGDSSMPGVYSDSPDTSSELSGQRPIKQLGESNC